MNTSTQDNWLTTKEVAQRIGVTERTVRKMIDDGRLQAINVGTKARRRYRVTRESLLEIGGGYVEKGRVPSWVPKHFRD